MTCRFISPSKVLETTVQMRSGPFTPNLRNYRTYWASMTINGVTALRQERWHATWIVLAFAFSVPDTSTLCPAKASAVFAGLSASTSSRL